MLYLSVIRKVFTRNSIKRIAFTVGGSSGGSGGGGDDNNGDG